MNAQKTNKKVSILQWIVLALFTLLIIREIGDYINPISWVVRHKQIFNLQYVYLYFPLILDPIGMYGLYKITRFEKKGFTYFYVSFVSSSILDFLRSTSFVASIIIILGNFTLFLLFYFSTKSIKTKSS